jgi:endonuclease YncB( thermonuclease family)
MHLTNEDKQVHPSPSALRMGRGIHAVKIRKISGLVTSIVDGNTFVMSVHHEDDQQGKEKYLETIRIYGRHKPSISTLSGILAKLDLEKKIVGHRVECEVLGRDDSDQMIARLPKKYIMSVFPANFKIQR